mmetsp:Transcript_8609/g.22231  ORF Transcript_8609/g.22231 Transcript_8609/m.22231 type:complete len:114 (-) Transcript_8609:152-493(-)
MPAAAREGTPHRHPDCGAQEMGAIPTARIDSLQADLDSTVDVMRSNLEKVLERDVNLQHLEDVSENLKCSSVRFKRTSRRLKRKEWWGNARWLAYAICLTVAIIAVAVIVVVV